MNVNVPSNVPPDTSIAFQQYDNQRVTALKEKDPGVLLLWNGKNAY